MMNITDERPLFSGIPSVQPHNVELWCYRGTKGTHGLVFLVGSSIMHAFRRVLLFAFLPYVFCSCGGGAVRRSTEITKGNPKRHRDTAPPHEQNTQGKKAIQEVLRKACILEEPTRKNESVGALRAPITSKLDVVRLD